jgi:hypothetical protein
LIGACGFSSRQPPKEIDGPMMMIDAKEIDATPIDGAPGSARKRAVTIPDAKIFGNLTDFPIWLVIDDMPGLGMKATTQGNDIYFTHNSAPLEWERVAWDKATGHLEAWVKVNLTDGQANVLDLRFGDPGPAHAPDPLATWSNGFVAVWHMEDSLGANTAVADARNTVNGTAVNGPTSTTMGKLGKAIDFDGNNDEITFTNPITANMSMTISAWVRLSDPGDGFSSVMCVGTNADGQSRFLHTKYSGLAYGFYGEDIQSTTNVHNNQFTLLHWVYDGGTKMASLYRDTNQVGMTATINGTVNTTGTGGHIGNAPMQWGPGGDTPNPVDGVLDEVRIANTPRSLAWIRTEHANQDDVGAFFMLGMDVAAD